MRNLIIAPHIDDELIGCFTVLVEEGGKTDVLYLHDLTPERMQEAYRSSSKLNFTILQDLPENLSAYGKVYVPSRSDWHLQHKQTYIKYRNIATHFYSVDMVGGKPLPKEYQLRKKELLDELYPSQKVLWERDHKYFLFESISTKDYVEYITHTINGAKVTVESEYADTVQFALLQVPTDSFESIAECLLPIVGTSRVEIEIGNTKRVYQ